MTEGTDCKDHARFDEALGALCAAKSAWVKTGLDARIRILGDIKAGTAVLAEAWAETAARKKLLPEGSPLAAEEWLSGPYGLITACDGLIATLTQMENRAYLKDLPKRYLPNGQLGVEVFPASWRDRLFLSGISAEVWMQKGVSEVNLASHCAPGYGAPAQDAKVALVLGAGNIASIAPLDCFQKLFQEQQVVLLKMNPVNAYLVDFLEIALAPLIARDALRIVTGGAEAGRYLTQHPRVDEIHITGSGATHDAIVWGSGKAGQAAKAARTPKNKRRITSELGAVCPTIVVPGPWSAQDIRFQAQHIATQKLHNGGYNCIACQALILPEDWSERAALMRETKRVLARNTRLPFYPGTQDRLSAFRAQGETHEIARAD
ncbi:MAG: aldehyde dehydrogenase family protein, partial [Pseudomonadota bacterium]